ncbi:MAG: protein kinase [Deltaproteobacteria bacterium]|nr:protein kinase [Deltaproteobacteria bacterium]
MRYCTTCNARHAEGTGRCPADGATTWHVAYPSDVLGRRFGDRYVLLEPVAEGGASVVYRAVDLRTDRVVALKVLRPGDEVDEKRFHRETRITGRLRSPHTVRVLDGGETADGERFLAMELVEGRSLAALVAAGEAPMAPGRAAHIAVQLLRSLAEVHEAGIVHRDVKPANVLVSTGPDGRDFVKLVDFGIARADNAADARITSRGLIVGTPAYMSPEQCRDETVDGRSDLYSVGVLLFETLTGLLPHDHSSTMQLMIGKLTRPAPRVAEVHPETDASAALQGLVDELLAIDPARRPATANDVLARLSPEAESWTARPRVSPAERIAAPPRTTRSLRTSRRPGDVLHVRLAEAVTILEANREALRAAAAVETDVLATKLLIKLAEHERSLVSTLKGRYASVLDAPAPASLTETLRRRDHDPAFSRLVSDLQGTAAARRGGRGIRGVLKAAVAARRRIATFWDERLERAADPTEVAFLRDVESQSGSELRRFEDLADRLGVSGRSPTGPLSAGALLAVLPSDETVPGHAWQFPREVETGVPAIDAQHLALFGVAKAILTDGGRADIHEIRAKVLPYLASYVQFHFEAEEAVMTLLGSPALRGHAARHERFRDSLARLIEAGPADASGADMRRRIAFWLALLVHHIRTDDRDLAAFLARADPEPDAENDVMRRAGVGAPPEAPPDLIA